MEVLLLDRWLGSTFICNLLDSTAATIIHILQIITPQACYSQKTSVSQLYGDTAECHVDLSERMAGTCK